jgi:hypothetical protein
VAVLISDKTDFNTTILRRDQESHSIHQDIMIENAYNVRTSNFLKETVLDWRYSSSSRTPSLQAQSPKFKHKSSKKKKEKEKKKH